LAVIQWQEATIGTGSGTTARGLLARLGIVSTPDAGL
jgi:hypothetical protein